ncbi:MAG: ATP-dependent DNA helicase [Gemmatimonadales bacterium]
MIAFPPGEDLANDRRLAPARLSAVDDEEISGAREQLDASRATPAAVAGDLGPSGPVAAVLSGATDMPYEDRASQRDMAAAVAELYRTGGVGLFEAGTGVGKSLAYLIPALRWAAAHGDRTVVSTNTINLQEQLVGKDLPLLAAALTDQPVRFALLKGWRNYLCLARLEQARSAGGTLFDAAEERDLAAVAAWARDTEDGSLGDAGAPQPRPEVWDEVAAEPDLCQRQKCPHYDACFVFRARRAAAQAAIVVVNHHLLMSDLAVRRVQQNWHDVAVLPPYSRLVVDEGHHLEEAAAAHLGSTVTRRGWQRLFARLDRRGGKGLLARLAQALGSADGLLGAATLDLLRTTVTPAVAAARERGELVFDMLATVLVSSSDRQLRLTAEFADHPAWAGGLAVALDDLLRDVDAVDAALELIERRHEGDAVEDEGVARILAELRGVARRLAAGAATLRLALDPADGGPPVVRWIEVRRSPRDRDRVPAAPESPAAQNVAVCVVPLDLAPLLREDLFARADTTIVTSATLAAEGRFEYLASRLGVDAPEFATRTGIFPSPFDYATQALLVVPTDLPAPNTDGERHAAGVVRIVRDVARAADGGVFALFTSHRDVREAAAALRAVPLAAMAGGPLELLVHGEDRRDALLRRFRESGRAVLLGTNSFWEGVDVPGSALRALIIARLPFRVPTEPVTAAQCEAIEARGGEPFSDYMLPQASLRLKQGFGRLIRSATDRGVVVLADPRVVSRTYGRGLLDALPPARRAIGRWALLRAKITAFYHSEGQTP